MGASTSSSGSSSVSVSVDVDGDGFPKSLLLQGDNDWQKDEKLLEELFRLKLTSSAAVSSASLPPKQRIKLYQPRTKLEQFEDILIESQLLEATLPEFEVAALAEAASSGVRPRPSSPFRGLGSPKRIPRAGWQAGGSGAWVAAGGGGQGWCPRACVGGGSRGRRAPMGRVSGVHVARLGTSGGGRQGEPTPASAPEDPPALLACRRAQDGPARAANLS